MNISWDAGGYRERFSFVPEYGEDVMNLLTVPKGSRVIDLGCGNGTLSKKLAGRGYQVLGVDASEEMIALARTDYPDLKFTVSDATTFSLEEKADAIFSNAVLHWIDKEKQPVLLANIAGNLKPGGELVCEFGGRGCAEAVHSTLESCFEERGLHYPRTFYFPTIGEYAPMLEQNGLMVEYAVLFDRPTVQQSEDGLTDWIHMFVKTPFAGVAPETEASILKEANKRLKGRLYRDGKWVIDYVRIRFRTRKVQ